MVEGTWELRSCPDLRRADPSHDLGLRRAWEQSPLEKEENAFGGETGRHQMPVSQTSDGRAPNKVPSALSLPTYAHLARLATQLQKRVCSNCGSGRSFDPAEAWTCQIWSQPGLVA